MNLTERYAAELGMTLEEFEAMHEFWERQREEEHWGAGSEGELAQDTPAKAPSSPLEPLPGPPHPPLHLKRKLYRDGSSGDPLPTGENLRRIMRHAPEWAGVLAYNELDCTVNKVKPPPFGDSLLRVCGPWSDNDTTLAQAAIYREYNVEFARREIDACVMATAAEQRYHPIRASLAKLAWDSAPRLATWLQDYLGAKDCSYTRSIGPKILIGAVARIMRPGCKLDTMPILEGPQGIRKSTVWKILAGKEDWFSDTAINIGDKDSYQSLRGSWFIEFGEMAAVLKRGGARLEAAKAYLTASCDRYRPSYGRHVETFERQCIFVGTTNEHDYLKDPTGNRRFWPIACGAIDIEGLTAVRDQLMAEALVAYKAGTSWHLSESDSLEAATEQAARVEEDPWDGIVVSYLRQAPDYITTSGVVIGVVGIPQEKASQSDIQRVAGILRRAGWAPRGNWRPNRWYRAGGKVTVKETT